MRLAVSLKTCTVTLNSESDARAANTMQNVMLQKKEDESVKLIDENNLGRLITRTVSLGLIL